MTQDQTAQLANLERAIRDLQSTPTPNYVLPIAQGVATIIMSGTSNITLTVPITNLGSSNSANLTAVAIQTGLPVATIANAHIALIGECTPGKLVIHAHPTSTITGTIGVAYLIY